MEEIAALGKEINIEDIASVLKIYEKYKDIAEKYDLYDKNLGLDSRFFILKKIGEFLEAASESEFEKIISEHSILRKIYSCYKNDIRSKLDPEPEPEPEPTPEPEQKPNQANPQDAFGMMLQSMISVEISKLDKKGLSDEKINQMITEQLKRHTKSLEFKREGFDPVKVGAVHESFEEMMHWIGQGCNVMLTGPAGSGKTTAGEKCAEALSLPFSSLSLSNDTRSYALFGFTNGEKYTTTEFRKRYEHGGVFILDEVDNGQANILSKLNSAIEQGAYAFDDGVVKKHKDFILISTANTWGFGGDRQYVGRNALDAAFLDRFVKIDWNYDEKLEMEIAPNKDFTKTIQSLRKAAAELKYKIIISPRASIRGGHMINAGIEGMTKNKILSALLWRGVSKDIVNKIISKARDNS